jgi:tRNA(adenine34) deaminase
MNYELFMGEALAEARLAAERGEKPSAAVAVVNDAMVARAHDRVRQTNDPTAHAVVVALREAARRLGTAQLGDATVFATQEPCAMCVGALLVSDVTELVYATPNRVDGAAGSVLQLAQHDGLDRRLQVVSGIRRAEAEELLEGAAALLPGPSRP